MAAVSTAHSILSECYLGETMKLFALPCCLVCLCLLVAGRGRAAEDEYAVVNGVKLHYVAQGTGQAMLFLHGFPEFWYAWKDQLAEFGKTHRAIALDMRGYNLSEKPTKVESYAVPILVADIKAFLDRVSPGKKAILVAHDWGGAVAWVYAALHPETLEKLVIINAPHPTVFGRELQSNPAQQKASGYMTFFCSPGAEQLLSANNYAALSGAVFGGSTKPESFTPADRKAYLDAWSQPGALTGGLNYYRAAQLGPPALGSQAKSGLTAMQLPDVTVPTLVIWGEKDTALLIGNLDGLDKVVPHLTIKRIPNGSHWVVHEEPEAVNGAIHEFLATHAAGGN
jgi:epoxide hydrolase 4